MTLFRTAHFRRLFGAQTVSRWGDTFSAVALVILVFRLTGSGLRVAGTVAFEIAPVLLFAPLAGAAADRLPKRTVMVGADLFRAATALLLAVAPHRLGVVYAAAFCLSAGSVFFNPASAAALPALVREDQLVRANSALWTAAVVSQIALAPVAGLVVAAAGARPAFAVNAASFVASAVLLRGLPSGASGPAGRATWRRQMADGLALVSRVPLVRLLAIVQALAALSAGATSALLVVLAERRLDLGPSGFGVLLAAIGAGAAAGPLVLARLPGDKLRPSYVFGPLALRGGVDLALAAARQPAVAAAALGVYGVGTSTGMVTFQSLMQSRLAPDVRGRAFALFDVVWQSSRLVSLGLGGIAADSFGVPAVYAWGGVLLLVAASVGALGSRRGSVRG